MGIDGQAVQERGKGVVPSRPALNDPVGTWHIRVTERTTGLAAVRELTVR